jgi:hypothetical protein
MSKTEDRLSPSRFANRVTKKAKGHKKPGRPDYETPEDAISYQPVDALTAGNAVRINNQAAPVSLHRLAWMDRPEVCPEIKGLV